MTLRLQRRLLLGLSLLFALVVLVNIVAAGLNRSTQAEIGQRAQFIQQSIALERLNQEIIRALAELAVRNKDADVAALLNANGVTFSAAPQAAGGPGAPGAAGGVPASGGK